MIRYGILDNSDTLLTIDSKECVVKRCCDLSLPYSKIYRIEKDGELYGQPIEIGDYLMVTYSYRLDKFYYKIIKLNTELWEYYKMIKEDCDKLDYPDECIAYNTTN